MRQAANLWMAEAATSLGRICVRFTHPSNFACYQAVAHERGRQTRGFLHHGENAVPYRIPLYPLRCHFPYHIEIRKGAAMTDTAATFEAFITAERERLGNERGALWDQIKELEERVAAIDAELKAITAYEAVKAG